MRHLLWGRATSLPSVLGSVGSELSVADAPNNNGRRKILEIFYNMLEFFLPALKLYLHDNLTKPTQCVANAKRETSKNKKVHPEAVCPIKFLPQVDLSHTSAVSLNQTETHFDICIEENNPSKDFPLGKRFNRPIDIFRSINPIGKAT